MRMVEKKHENPGPAMVLGFGNLKGGVGKSKIAIETAYILAERYKQEVLFINNDKQVNSSRFFDAAEDVTLADVFYGTRRLEEVIQNTRYEKIDVVASNMDLAAANLTVLNNREIVQHEVLKTALQEIQHNYNFIVIDNPPDINMSMFNGLLVTNQFIGVATPDSFSLEGIQEIKIQLADAKRYNPKLKVRGCVINKFIPSEHSLRMIGEIEKEMPPIFKTKIRFTIDKVDASTIDKQSILEYSPRCGFAMDIKRFVQEVLYLHNKEV